MTIPRLAALLSTATLALACTRTVVVAPRPRPAPPVAERPRPATAATLGIPPGHLPRAGECRIWSPGVAPGRQRTARSRSCVGIARVAPAGSWVVYRPTRDRKLVHVRVVDQRRPGVIVVVRVFDVESGRFLRDEAPQHERPDDADDRDGRDRDRRDSPGRVDRPVPPRSDPRATPEERPRPPEAQPRPPEDRPAPPEILPGPARPPKPDPQPPAQPPPQAPDPRGPFGDRRTPETAPAPAPGPVAPLDIPPGHLPSPGACRIWIPGTPPGRQPHRASGDCEQLTRDAPPGSWVVYRPTADRKVVHVRVVDARRAGVVVIVRVFDAESGRFLREEPR